MNDWSIFAAVLAAAVLVAVTMLIVNLARLRGDLAVVAAGRDPGLSQRLEIRSAGVEHQVTEVRRTMAEVAALIDELHLDRVQQHSELMTRLAEQARVHSALSDAAGGLRDALAHPIERGSWGERTAEDLLARCGLVEGVSFVRQQRLGNGSRPDISVLLPGGRHLHMDVKFPASNYLRSLDADGAEAEALRRQFLVDVRARINEVSAREYRDPDDTVGYVLAFIPNEGIHQFVCSEDPGLIDHALSRGVILCSPSTLFAVLAVVRQAVQTAHLTRRTDDLLAAVNEFAGQWERFSGHLDRLERQVATVSSTVGELAGPRRRQLQRSVDRVTQFPGVDPEIDEEVVLPTARSGPVQVPS